MTRCDRLLVAVIVGLLVSNAPVLAQVDDRASFERRQLKEDPQRRSPDLSVVSDELWDQIDNGVDRGLAYLASTQLSDGSLPTRDSGKPAVTALAVMAFLSAGHQPGSGPYGEQINRMIDFVLRTQRADGLFTYLPTTTYVLDWSGPTQVATYNQGICGLMLGEVYGMTSPERAARIRPALEKAIQWTRQLQQREIPDEFADDRGGFRYMEHARGKTAYSDVSVTSWQLMFYRSANNAGFAVPHQWVDEALAFVRNCFDAETGGFVYTLREERNVTRATTGAGVLSLFLAGRYDADIERLSGSWLLDQNYDRFNEPAVHSDRYFYSCYYVSQAAYQLGGRYWAALYPEIAGTLTENQRADGQWDRCHFNPAFGETYTTALVVLTLTPPYQLLPIYQR